MRALLGSCCCLVLTACGLQAPARGVPLGDGAVSRARFEVRVRSTELLPVDVFFPSTSDGLPTGSDHPALVLLQGGSVDVERYHWLAEAVAREGLVVALPHHPSRLAILSLDNGAFARQLLVEPPPGSNPPPPSELPGPRRCGGSTG